MLPGPIRTLAGLGCAVGLGKVGRLIRMAAAQVAEAVYLVTR
jgi:hypothetical protein